MHPLLLGTDQVRLPMVWSGVRVRAAGARALRAHLRTTGAGEVSLRLADHAGAPVASVDSLLARPVTLDRIGPDSRDCLFTVDWVPIGTGDGAPANWATLGVAGLDAPVAYPDLGALLAALRADDADPPEAVVVAAPQRPLTDALADLADLVRAWLDEDRLAGIRLAVLTRGAVAVVRGDKVTDPGAAAVHGLVHAVCSEQPGRLVLIDIDDQETSRSAVSAALATGEPRLAIRDGAAHVARLTRESPQGMLVPPAQDGRWKLALTGHGGLEGLALAPSEAGFAPLGAGEVRVAVRATGLNFRDVLLALGMVPADDRPAAGEAAGVVVEVGSEVTGLVPGDRVMGLMSTGIGPSAVTDQRLVTIMPRGMSFAEAAAIPIVYMTAYYGLVDLARARRGESVLVHAATGGVGMAAVQLARHLGLEVFGTASPGKWPTLHAMGVERIASSRSLDFEGELRTQSYGRGVDIVLNSLAREYVDASLRLLAPGGRFLEMGKTDKRDPARVAADFPSVSYQVYDLLDAGPERIQQMLVSLRDLFDAGVLVPLPVTAWDIRHAREAVRYFSQARHVGKIVLTLPVPLRSEGTVLITGGTGVLGALTARHLVARHGVRHLLLLSRAGGDAPGVSRLVAELTELGAEVTVAAADVAVRAEVAAVLAAIPDERPLTAVFHAAGVLDDGLIGTMSRSRLETVLRPKADGARHLHELTADMDLAEFVLYSSAAGVLGAPGQANYAAASAFLDGLAQHRRHRGLPATSLAWGLWREASAMTGHLGEAEFARMARSGMAPLDSEQGMRLLDAARQVDRPQLTVMNLDLRAAGRAGELPPLLRGLTAAVAAAATRRRVGDAGPTAPALRGRLAAVPPAAREALLLDLVRGHAATVLGHDDPAAVDASRAFRELGFDSLTAVELRNRLEDASGLRLPPTVVFDHPTPAALARRLLAELALDDGAGTARTAFAEFDRLEAVLATLSDERLHPQIAARLEALLWQWNDRRSPAETTQDTHDLTDASDEQLFEALDRELGIS
jgi:polyketide synthase 12